MMDKIELEELLVKLKLGTLSVEGAVSELERSFYPVSGESPRVFKPGGFEEIFYCSGLFAGDVLKLTSSVRSKRIPFMCVRLGSDAAAELKTSLRGEIEVFRGAGIAALRPREKTRFEGSAVIACDGAVPCRAAVEAAVALDLLGVKTKTVCGSLDKFGGDFLRIENCADVSAVIGVSERFSAFERLASELSVPLIGLPARDGSEFSRADGFFTPPLSLSLRGVTFVAENDGFGAALAAYRASWR